MNALEKKSLQKILNEVNDAYLSAVATKTLIRIENQFIESKSEKDINNTLKYLKSALTWINAIIDEK